MTKIAVVVDKQLFVPSAYQRRVLDQCLLLNQAGHTVHVIELPSVVRAHMRPRSTAFPTDVVPRLPFSSIRFGAGLFKTNCIGVQNRMRSILSKGNFDSVLVAGTAASAFVPKDIVPMTYDIHGDLAAELELRGNLNYMISFVRDLHHDSLQAASRISVVSPGMLAWIGAHKTKASLLPCKVFRNDVTRQRSLRWPNSIAYVGSFTSYQPISLVSSTMLELSRNYGLDIAVFTRTNRRKVWEHFKQAPYGLRISTVENSDIIPTISEYGWGVVPRERNQVNAVACPTKIGEYIVAGLPVLMPSYVGGWHETNVFEFATPTDGEGFCETFSSVLANPEGLRARVQGIRENWFWSERDAKALVPTVSQGAD